MILATWCWLSTAIAMQPGLDSRAVVRQLLPVSLPPRTPGSSNPILDDGEFLVDTGGTMVPAPDKQTEPAVAFDGKNYLVVWSDSGSTGAYTIYGARVTSEGKLLDPGGFVVSPSTLSPYRPAVAFDGTNSLVVWETYASGGQCDIYGARVTPAGVVLDTAGIAISTADWYQVFAAVAFDGTNYFVVWENSTDDSCNIRGARVTPAGILLDTTGIVVSASAGYQACPVLAFDGTNFLAAWMDTRNDSAYDIYGTRVTPTGVLLDTAGIAICTATWYQWYPALAFDGSNFLVVWGDMRSGSYCHVYGARVTPQGEVLDTAGIVIAQPLYGGGYLSAVTYDGDNFLAAWQEFRAGTGPDIRGARVTTTGEVLDTESFAIAEAEASQSLPTVASARTNCLVMWQDERNANSNIRGARVSPEGVLLDPAGIVLLRTVNYDQDYPGLGFDGTNYLVAWQGSDWGVCGARVTQGGTPLDPAGLVLAQTGWKQAHPVLTFDGTNYLLVWQDSCSGRGWDISGARVTPLGEVIDPSGFAISVAGSDQWCPAGACYGTDYLVVWQDDRSGGAWADIYGARVTPEGNVLDSTGIAISRAAHDQRVPAVSFDGLNYLVVWQDGRSGSGYDIYGALVTPQGKVLGDSGFAISQAVADQCTPAISFDGTNYLVVWQDGRTDIDYDIYGARVTPRGEVLDTSSIVISQATGDQGRPALGFDGTSFLVAWEDTRNGSDLDIYGARVTPDGTVFDSGCIVSQEQDQSYPSLCCGPGNQMLLAYTGWAGTIGGKEYNTYRIWGKVDPNPGIQQTLNDELTTMGDRATIVRNVLFVPASPFTTHSSLFDMTGRRVMSLRPGSNDVSTLSPGVYFVRRTSGVASNSSNAAGKVVITR